LVCFDFGFEVLVHFEVLLVLFSFYFFSFLILLFHHHYHFGFGGDWMAEVLVGVVGNFD
jgi:hypothetical protein